MPLVRSSYTRRFSAVLPPECGGIFNATGCHIAIDSLGNAYVTGPTQSSDFPTTAGALDTTHNGNTDVFLTQFNANGTGLLYSTFLGSTSSDISTGIALDTLGNVYLTGSTQQGFSPPFFPTTPGAYDTSFNGSWDAFVTKISDTTPAPILSSEVYKESFGAGWSGSSQNATFSIESNSSTIVPFKGSRVIKAVYTALSGTFSLNALGNFSTAGYGHITFAVYNKSNGDNLYIMLKTGPVRKVHASLLRNTPRRSIFRQTDGDGFAFH